MEQNDLDFWTEVPRDEDSLVVLAGHFFFRMNIDCEDGVTPGRVLVHVVSPYRPALKTWNQMFKIMSLYR